MHVVSMRHKRARRNAGNPSLRLKIKAVASIIVSSAMDRIAVKKR